MPPKAFGYKKPAAAVVEAAPEEEWEGDKDNFFADFESSGGPSKRKRDRETALLEERRGVSLETLAMDPALSAADARRKIADRVRARAGLKPLGSANQEEAAASEQVPKTNKDKIEAKFARKEQRLEETQVMKKKFKKIDKLKQKQQAAIAFKAKRKGRR